MAAFSVGRTAPGSRRLTSRKLTTDPCSMILLPVLPVDGRYDAENFNDPSALQVRRKAELLRTPSLLLSDFWGEIGGPSVPPIYLSNELILIGTKTVHRPGVLYCVTGSTCATPTTSPTRHSLEV